jgi:cobalt-zinc-cadmium efflux system membrane fusion protein
MTRVAFKIVSRASVRRIGTGLLLAGAVAAFALSNAMQPTPSQAGPAAAAQAPAQAPLSVQVKSEQMHQLDVVRVEPHEFRQQKFAIGQIAFNEDASTTVLAPFSGRVTRLIAKVGDDVKRGDPLFEIDSPEVVQAQTDLIAAVHAVEKANSLLALAKRVMDRQQALLAEKATAMREVDQARNDYAAADSDFRTAQGALAAARNRLRVIVGRGQEEIDRVERDRSVNPHITVNAPIDGTVIARKVGPGQYVRSDAADSLYSISDLSTMWLKAFVPEADIPYVHVGQQLEVKVTALPTKTFTARVIAIGASSDQATRRVIVRSEIPNPDRVLKAEMFATFKIWTGDPEVAPAVPAEAVIREGPVAAVWVRQTPSVFQRRNVTLGSEQDGNVQVRDGVSPGEFVVSRGAIFVDNESRQ